MTPKVAGLDPRIENALLKALSKKPDQRFPSTRAFSDALGASTLRMDAPKILHNDTRLIEAPVMPAMPPPAPSGMLATVPVLNKLPPDLRAAALGGGGALVVALAIIAFLFFPLSKPPTVVATKPAATQPGRECRSSDPAGSRRGRTAIFASADSAHIFSTPATRPLRLPPLHPSSSTVDITPPLDPATLPGPLADIVVAANRGDPAAQNQLGVKYAQGEDPIPRNDIKAVDLYREAANQGFAKAETNLGDMYLYGRGGLIQSYTDAASWYLKASQQEWPDAQYRLAYMYEKGIGPDKDVQRAVQLYRSAAEHGYPEAQNLLGFSTPRAATA